MKNTLLALMLVSSLFVISCGADATKPGDAYKSQLTETTTGTATVYADVTADATSGVYNTINIENLYQSQDGNSTIAAGTKITEIVQVVTVTEDTATTTTTNTNAVTATTKNADGGIYQFTINNNTAATIRGAMVTYKYSKREAAPTVVRETTGTCIISGYTASLEINDPYFNDENKRFDKYIVSILNQSGLEVTAKYNYNNVANTITFTSTSGLTDGAAYTVRYSYTDVEIMTDTPLKGDVTVDATGMNPTTATIQLDAATYAGRSYYLKAILTETSTVPGAQPTTETIYHNNANPAIVPSTGAITVNATTLTSITSGTYEIWVY